MKKYIVILIAFLALTSCSDVQKNERIITVSIEPLRFFTEEIAGNKFKVSTMVPEGMSPETYEPTAQQMMKLAQSDMFVKVGGIGFEVTWMKRMEANAPHTLVVNSSEGISEIKTSNGVSDPHTWMSTVNASIIAQNICNALIAIDQKDSLYFRQRLESLCEKIQATDLNVRKYLTKDNPHLLCEILSTETNSHRGTWKRTKFGTNGRHHPTSQERPCESHVCAKAIQCQEYTGHHRICRRHPCGD